MKKQPRHLMIWQWVSIKSMNLVQKLIFNEQATNNAAYDASFANSAKSMDKYNWPRSEEVIDYIRIAAVML